MAQQANERRRLAGPATKVARKRNNLPQIHDAVQREYPAGIKARQGRISPQIYAYDVYTRKKNT